MITNLPGPRALLTIAPLLLLAVLIPLFLGAHAAIAQEQTPHRYIGVAYINSTVAPENTPVTAHLADILQGATTVTAAGVYVLPLPRTTPPYAFTVNGIVAAQTVLTTDQTLTTLHLRVLDPATAPAPPQPPITAPSTLTTPADATGSAGARGQPGPAGADGRNGHDGADGRNGDDGADGQNGADGADGRNGDDGADGRNGDDGADGPPGPEGPQGERGAPGYAGVDGHSGTGAAAHDHTMITITLVIACVALAAAVIALLAAVRP